MKKKLKDPKHHQPAAVEGGDLEVVAGEDR
jgi:hypothetical protein